MLKFLTLPIVTIWMLGACVSRGENKPAEPLDASASLAPAKASQTMLHKIAFGSCNRQDYPQPMWRKLSEEKPDLWIWAGDAIYADSEDPAAISRMYAQQLRQPEYSGFLLSRTPIVGIYDDHDFGANDGGAEYPKKRQTMQLFLDFVNEPKDSPRRQQQGLYTRYIFGPAGKRIKVLLTDTRYNRQKPGAESDMLGAEQWIWLEKELATRDAELLILVSGTEILPFEHDFEKWANFPKSRARLLNLLDQSPFKNLVLISGDRHIAELSKLVLSSGKALWEVTSSGLTHSYQEFTEARNKNSLRVGTVLARLNYGILEIDWESASPHIDLEIRDINKETILQQRLPLLH